MAEPKLSKEDENRIIDKAKEELTKKEIAKLYTMKEEMEKEILKGEALTEKELRQLKNKMRHHTGDDFDEKKSINPEEQEYLLENEEENLIVEDKWKTKTDAANEAQWIRNQSSILSVGGNFNLAPPKNSNIKSTFNVKGNPGNLATNTNAQIIITPNKSSNVSEGENEIDIERLYLFITLYNKKCLLENKLTNYTLEKNGLLLEDREGINFYNNANKMFYEFETKYGNYHNEIENLLKLQHYIAHNVLQKEVQKIDTRISATKEELKEIDQVLNGFKK